MTAPDSIVVSVPDGRRLAFGLAWKYLPGIEGATAASEAKTLATKLTPKRTHGVILAAPDSTRPMVGFVVGPPLKGALSAAAIACASPQQQLLVARLAEDLYWICVAGRNSMDPDQADVLVDRARANHLLTELMTQSSARSGTYDLVAIEGLDLGNPWLHGATQVPWSSALPALRQPQVRSLVERSSREKLRIAAVILIPSVFVGVQVQDYYLRKEQARKTLEAREVAQAEAVKLANDAALREAAERQAIEDALQADTRTAAPVVAAQSCQQLFGRLGRRIGGWDVGDVRCDLSVGQMTAELLVGHPTTASYGTPASLRTAANELGGSATVATTLRQATLVLPLPTLGPREGVRTPSDLPPWDAFIEGVGTQNLIVKARTDNSFRYSIADPTQRVISYTDPVAVSADGAPVKRDADPSRCYRMTSVSYTGRHLLPDLIADFDGPGTRLDTITWNPNSGSYTTALTLSIRP